MIPPRIGLKKESIYTRLHNFSVLTHRSNQISWYWHIIVFVCDWFTTSKGSLSSTFYQTEQLQWCQKIERKKEIFGENQKIVKFEIPRTFFKTEIWCWFKQPYWFCSNHFAAFSLLSTLIFLLLYCKCTLSISEHYMYHSAYWICRILYIKWMRRLLGDEVSLFTLFSSFLFTKMA